MDWIQGDELEQTHSRKKKVGADERVDQALAQVSSWIEQGSKRPMESS
jgi:hypothetical protein